MSLTDAASAGAEAFWGSQSWRTQPVSASVKRKSASRLAAHEEAGLKRKAQEWGLTFFRIMIDLRICFEELYFPPLRCCGAWKAPMQSLG